MESLPEEVQNRVAEHLREYIQDLHDELKKLIAAAKRAKQEIAEGLAKPIYLCVDDLVTVI
jgi:chromosomal replication initiation ATPase DnaA